MTTPALRNLNQQIARLLAALALWAGGNLGAHTLPISYLTVVPDTEYLHLELTLNPFELSFFAELDGNRNGRLDPGEWESQQATVTEKLLAALEVTVAGKAVRAETAGVAPDLDSHHATLRAHYRVDARSAAVTVTSGLAGLTSGSHFTQVTFGAGGQRQTARLDSLSPSVTLTASNPVPSPAPPADPIRLIAPPDETLRLALPMLVVLGFCLLGWYARQQQRKPRPPADDTTPKTSP